MEKNLCTTRTMHSYLHMFARRWFHSLAHLFCEPLVDLLHERVVQDVVGHSRLHRAVAEAVVLVVLELAVRRAVASVQRRLHRAGLAVVF